LYCNLKRADFLHYLPTDLVAYMKHITDLNRERNQQIVEQAKEINELLLTNNITPIFLKGTGNLLEGLYDDILSSKHHQKTKRKLLIKSRLDIIYGSFFDAKKRQWLIKRITDKS
jgi:hypothetical protein